MDTYEAVITQRMQQERSKTETLARLQGMHTEAVAQHQPDARLPQLVALFARCDERGRKTILAIAGVQAGFATGRG